MHYLDHNATSPLRPESLSAVTHALAVGGNPSSIHARGRAARVVMEDAVSSVNQTAPGIFDVRSGSDLKSLEGTPYSEW